LKRERHSEPEKEWRVTKPRRMNDLRNNIRGTPIVIPAGNPEPICAKGRTEAQSVPIKLPPFDFERL
jgi:hypothetical protein